MIVVAKNNFLESCFLAAFRFTIYGDQVMKRILLFLLLFCFFGCGILYAAPGQGAEKIVVHPLFNFDGIFETLLNILMRLFLDHIEIVLGFVFVMLLLSYFQGMLEGEKMRLDRARRDREYERDTRVRSEMRRIDKELARERELILKYVRDSESAGRVQYEMRDTNWKDSLHLFKNNDDLKLAPLDDDPDVYPNNMSMFAGKTESQEYYDEGIYEDVASHDVGGRWTTYWRPDGEEEGSKKDRKDLSFEDTVTIGESSTVIMRDRRRDRFHRGMDDDDEGGGY
jgi:hypothetical protein